MADAPEYETELEPAPPTGKPPLGGLRRRGIYLLPNLFTTGVLFCGFFAIVQAMNGRFEIGCIAIFVAMVLDGMDGRVARTFARQQTSKFFNHPWRREVRAMMQPCRAISAPPPSPASAAAIRVPDRSPSMPNTPLSEDFRSPVR